MLPLHCGGVTEWQGGGAMAGGEPFKLTRMALKYMNVERDAASLGLTQLEQAGLIKIERRPGQQATVAIVTHTTITLYPRHKPAGHKS